LHKGNTDWGEPLLADKFQLKNLAKERALVQRAQIVRDYLRLQVQHGTLGAATTRSRLVTRLL